MARLTIEQAFQLAVRRQQAGELPHAERLYRQILAYQPSYADALHNLGLIAHQTGRDDVAEDCIHRAIAVQPGNPEAHYHLGVVLQAGGQHDEAIVATRRAIALRPHFAGAFHNLGAALQARGQFEEALAAGRQAIALESGSADAHCLLGTVLGNMGRADEAIAAHRRAIALRPDFSDAHNNLGVALAAKGQLDEAVAAYRRAIALKPSLTGAHCNLGNALKDMGQIDAAIAAYRQAVALDPRSADAASNLLFAMHFHPGLDARAITEEHRRWDRQHAAPLKKFIHPHANDRSPERRLRIGYISPDFRNHPVGRFVLPLLAHHNKDLFEIFAYAQVSVPDAMTQRLRSHADAWRSIVGLSDAQAADLVRQDQIDILVDLAMHSAHGRLLVFARKPAPVQVTYLAYCSTTGLETIDYRLSDPYLDPFDAARVGPFDAAGQPAGDESVYSERTVRLPETWWCYQPLIAPLDVGPLPVLQHGHITFGCLNNFGKIGEPALAAWAKLLRAIPGSRLLLHAREGTHRQRVQDRLAREGVDPGRVEFAGYLEAERYIDLYRRIDIALDTFPYGGGTTTCDALWMGVPVVSLAGKTAVGRGGLSILSNIGLPDLVARSEEAYVQLARELASDLPRLANLRSTLRHRMSQSALMDAPRYASNIEAAYRQMWRQWCTRIPAGG